MFDRRTAMAALAAWASLPLGASAQTTTILFNSFIPPTHPVNVRVFKPWAEEIEKATQGRVKIEMPPSSLAAPPQQMDGAVKGVFDMAYQFHGLVENKVKLPQVAHLLGVNSTAKGSSIALWRTYERFFKSADEYKNLHLLGLFVFQSGTIFGMKKPIDALADVKGIKLFGLPGVAATVLEAAGAGVVAVPAVRSYEIISGGTVDAFAGYSVLDASAFKTLQYARYITDLPGGLTAPSFALFMNKKKWDSLSAADREVLTRMTGEALAARMGVLDEIEIKLRADAAAQGIQIRSASTAFSAEMRRLASPIEQAWLKDAQALGVDGPAALAFYKEQATLAAK